MFSGPKLLDLPTFGPQTRASACLTTLQTRSRTSYAPISFREQMSAFYMRRSFSARRFSEPPRTNAGPAASPGRTQIRGLRRNVVQGAGSGPVAGPGRAVMRGLRGIWEQRVGSEPLAGPGRAVMRGLRGIWAQGAGSGPLAGPGRALMRGVHRVASCNCRNACLHFYCLLGIVRKLTTLSEYDGANLPCAGTSHEKLPVKAPFE